MTNNAQRITQWTLMSLRKKITELLEQKNISELTDLSEREHGVFRILISLAYDKHRLICWRAIEALGIISGNMSQKEPERIRNLIGRLLWTIREESGGIGWSAPEMLGEIVRNSPDIFADIGPIISSFYEEDMLKRGVLRALVRIGDIRPDLIQNAAALVKLSLKHEDPEIRFYAIRLAGCLRLTACLNHIKDLRDDNNEITIYENGDFRTMKVGDIAKKTVILLHSNGSE